MSRVACSLIVALATAGPAAVAWGLAPVAQPPAQVPRVGVRGMNIDPHNPWARAEPEDLAALGVTRVRFVYRSDHGAVAEALAKYIAGGFAVTLVLNNETLDLWGVHCSPAEFDDDDWSRYRKAFNKVAGEIGRRYKDAGDRLTYEVWNEPNLERYYVPARVFGRMLQDASKILKQEHPKARVVSGAILQIQDPNERHPSHVSYLREALEEAPEMLLHVDRIGLHTYGPPDMFPSLLEEYAAIGRPVSVTEWGRCEPDEARKIAAMREFLEIFSQSPAVAEAYYFAWSNTQALCSHYGITQSLDEPDPSGRWYELDPAFPPLFGGG